MGGKCHRRTELNELVLEEDTLHLDTALGTQVAEQLLELARALRYEKRKPQI